MNNYNIWYYRNYKKRHVVYGQKETKQQAKILIAF